MDRIAHMLTEILAIKLYEHDHPNKKWPPLAGASTTSWNACDEETRQLYRDAIGKANTAEDWITAQ